MSVETTTGGTSLLKIYYSNGSCFIWNASDARYVREELRIVGTLVGCLPRAPRQNVHLGLPLQLMPEETTLLLEKGFAEIVKEEYADPSEETLQQFKQCQAESHRVQVDLFRAERRDEIKRRLPEIIAGKKAKRNRILEERKKKGEQIDEGEFEKEIEIDPDEMDIPAITEQQMLVQIHLACQDRRKSCVTVDWKYPESEREKLRYRVFKDLWEKGQFITGATKFGGDFLAYAGDPSRFHALYVVVCRPHTTPIPVTEIITLGRLGSNVKKTVVFCSEDENGTLCYTSVQWTGIS